MKAMFVAAMLAGLRTAAAEASLDLPEPVAPPPREVTEDSTSPVYYRLPAQLVAPLARTSIGAHTRWSGSRDTEFAFDARLGAAIRMGRDAAASVWIEGGYSYVYGREHLAALGVGVARSPRGLFSSVIALEPQVVAGRIDGETGIGLRTSAIAGFGGTAVEAAYQLVFVGGKQV